MKHGVTLLETLIALFISTLLFQAIFQLTQLSFTESKKFRLAQRAFAKELESLHDYDKALLEGRRIELPFKVASLNHQESFTEFKSFQGYLGVTLP